MSCISSPLGALDFEVLELAVGSTLHQFYSASYPAGSFHPGTGPAPGNLARPTRFAPIQQQAPGLGPVPYLYAGGTLQCAIYETVFHDVDFRCISPTVFLSGFADKAHCELTVLRKLRLVKLFGTGLKKIRAERVDLIESLPICYGATANWAQALYDQDPKIDGLVWRSRRLDDQDSYLLFGDRVAGKDFAARAVSGPIKLDSSLRDRVYAEALSVGVTILP